MVWPKGKPWLQFMVILCLGLLGLGRVVNVYVPVYYKKIGKQNFSLGRYSLRLITWKDLNPNPFMTLAVYTPYGFYDCKGIYMSLRSLLHSGLTQWNQARICNFWALPLNDFHLNYRKVLILFVRKRNVKTFVFLIKKKKLKENVGAFGLEILMCCGFTAITTWD